MTFLWIALTAAVACLGGWPLTAGVLRLAKSRTVRAADAHELHAGDAPDDTGDAPVVRPAPGAARAVPQGAPPAPKTPPAVGSRDARQAAPAADGAPDPTGAGVLRGGLLIGVLERAAVVLAILAGQPIAIAYVVAIKGLGRYPELKQAPAASERFIIGTLASLLWAAVVATAAKDLLL